MALIDSYVSDLRNSFEMIHEYVISSKHSTLEETSTFTIKSVWRIKLAWTLLLRPRLQSLRDKKNYACTPFR